MINIMRKFFTLIGAALLSLAMQATVVNQGIDLSSASTYGTEGTEVSWDASTKTITTLGENSWKGIHTASALDATGYSELVLVLAEGYATQNVNLGVEYSGGTPSSHNVTNVAGKNTIRLVLNGSNISDIIIRVTNAGSSAQISSLYLYKVIGKEEEHNLFSGTQDVGNWDWYSRVMIDKGFFAPAHDGDKIRITYTSGASGQCAVRFKDETEGILEESGEYAAIEQAQSTPATYEFVLRNSDIVQLQAKGMHVTGTSLVVTRVDLITYSQQVLVERTLNTGNEVLDWEQHWVHQGDLPTLAAGDELRVTVSAVESGKYWQVNFRHNDSGVDAITFGSSDETTPKVYSFTLTAEQASNINATGKLLVVGSNVTLSRFAIAQPQSIYDAAWRGETSFDDSDWGVNVEIGANKFTGLAVGDLICLNLSELANGGTVRLVHTWTEFAPQVEYVFNANHAAPMTVNFVVNQDMRDAILSEGIRFRGSNFTLTDVFVLKADARTESYTLTVSDAGLATLVLPFNVPTLPEGVKAYTLSNDGSAVIDAVEVSALRGDKPVLIIAEAGEYVLTSELGGNADISGKNHWPVSSYVNEALVGNYAPTLWVPSDGLPNGNNYILQNGAEGVGFYKVTGDPVCTLAPYRAYLRCGYNAMAGGSSAPMRIRFQKDTVTGVENAQAATDVQKLLINGQLYIIRDGVTYTIQGQIVK